VHGTYAARIAPSEAHRERLARAWLAAIVERTPLAEIGALPMRRLAADAPALVAAICDALERPEPGELDEDDRARAADLANLHSGPGSAARIGRDLGTLQSLFVRELELELGNRGTAELAEASAKLAEAFGSIHGAVAAELTGLGAAHAALDQVTGFAGSAGLDEFLGRLLGEQRRYGHPFSLALVDVDGLGRINDAYGRDAGNRMLAAIAAILRRQLRDADRAFRLEEDEFAIVAPHTNAGGLSILARRVAQLIASSQAADGPRLAIAAGVVECPADGLSAERLLESAAEATYAAKASGAPVARSANGSDAVLQDP
jgi:diguanylate cyclase (GGDEF)-like protein